MVTVRIIYCNATKLCTVSTHCTCAFHTIHKARAIVFLKNIHQWFCKWTRAVFTTRFELNFDVRSLFIKSLDKLQEWIFFSHQNNKQQTSSNICLEMTGFEFNWKITFKNKQLKYVIFYIELTEYICSSCSKFSTSLVTIYKLCSKYPLPELMHAWARVIMCCRTIENVLGQFWIVLTCIKIALVQCLFIFNVTEYPRNFKCHHRPKCKRLSSTSCWDVSRKLTCLLSHTDRKIFP